MGCSLAMLDVWQKKARSSWQDFVDDVLCGRVAEELSRRRVRDPLVCVLRWVGEEAAMQFCMMHLRTLWCAQLWPCKHLPRHPLTLAVQRAAHSQGKGDSALSFDLKWLSFTDFAVFRIRKSSFPE